jgi:N utilization substance protein B
MSAAVVSGSRRRARAHGLQVLYALDLNPEAEAADVASWGSDFTGPDGGELDEEGAAFARHLVGVVEARAQEIDDIIQAASKNWRLERMARVDRNILRLATAELFAGDAPVKVVLNEAVELAKRFGTAESPPFVNGILDRIAHRIGGKGGEGPSGRED